MSIEAVVWALTLAPIPAPEKGSGTSRAAMASVLVGLANHADPDGRDAFPRLARLAAYTCLNEKSVRLALAGLERAGLIVPSDGRVLAARVHDPRHRPNSWDLRLELVDEQRVPAVEKPADPVEEPVDPRVGTMPTLPDLGWAPAPLRVGTMPTEPSNNHPSTDSPIGESGPHSAASEPEPVVHSPASPSKRGTRIPPDFKVTPELREWAREAGVRVDLDAETEAFFDYWRAAPGQRGVKLDWPATWRNWMRKTLDSSSPNGRRRRESTIIGADEWTEGTTYYGG